MLRSTIGQLIVTVFLCLLAFPQSNVSQSRDRALLTLLEVLDRNRVSSSIEFSGPCKSLASPDLPVLHGRASDPTLQGLRLMLGDGGAFRVTQPKAGLVRIKQWGVSSDLLKVHIKNVNFENGEYGRLGPYSSAGAMVAVLDSPEIVKFMKKQRIDWAWKPIFVSTGNVALPPPDTPHVPIQLSDVSLSQAFDLILQTFPGIWVYEQCPPTEQGHRRVAFGFFQSSRSPNTLRAHE